MLLHRVAVGSHIGPAQDRRGKQLGLRAALETPMEALVAATGTNAVLVIQAGHVVKDPR
ncbi:hypothetical protein [Streptomyces sp. NPDC093099]|uniref:hypothetical protein n=1 Tax=Streptomyces sp. NPDC093099 TaxID=3366028 RepID=UPI00382A73CF